MKENSHRKISLYTITLVCVVFFQWFIYNSAGLEAYLNRTFNIDQLSFLVKMVGIIITLLVLNTSYYSLFAHFRRRMFYFVIGFSIYAVLEIMKQVFYNPLFLDLGASTQSMFVIYYEVFFAIFTIIIALASVLDSKDKISDQYAGIMKMIPLFITLGMIVILPLMMRNRELLVNYYTVRRQFKVLQLASLATAIFFYLKFYLKERNEHIRYFATGLGIVFITKGFEYFMTLTPYQLLMESVVFSVGLWFLNIATFRYNIGIPYQQLQSAQRQVNLYAQNLEKIVDKRTAEIEAVNLSLVKEIDQAKRIQQSILPAKKLQFKGALFLSEYVPCERLSGDFYDIYPIDDDNIGMYILDVSGHGISAALLTMFCNNYVRSTENLIKRFRGLKPHRNLQNFYEEFNKMNFPDEMHMVILFASYNQETRVLKYSNGGLNVHPIVLRNSGEIEYLDRNTGFPICKISTVFIPEYETSEIELSPGDRLLFFTDGLVDERKNKIMTEEELPLFFKAHRQGSLQDFNNALKQKISEASELLEDDITYFIMEVQ
ncbi:MAG: hypothetical protein AVO33_03695 [delta proteobacterium ML8_F1]|nr:MAG: hypothetical protein AVO33_03695 [delta proteobacterium ML8_F1]